VVTEHTTTIKGQKISYKATTGTMPVWDEDGKAIAGLFYTYYERSDVNRFTPISNFFQWWSWLCFGMDAYYTGPNLLNIDDEGYPLQPYGIKENLFYFRCC
jgi:hypothetical protein